VLVKSVAVFVKERPGKSYATRGDASGPRPRPERSYLGAAMLLCAGCEQPRPPTGSPSITTAPKPDPASSVALRLAGTRPSRGSSGTTR
jgi:hypothetical protein